MSFKIPEFMHAGIEMRLDAFLDESSQQEIDEYERRVAASDDKSTEKRLEIILEIMG